MASRKLLARLKPGQGAILMLPPTPLAVLGRLVRGKNHIHNVYDLHTGFFYDPKWQWASRFTLRLMRGATAIVTNSNLAKECERVGIQTFVLHDILNKHERGTGTSSSPVLCPVSYSNDEPIEEILSVARRMPELQWTLTGKAPEEVTKKAPDNVQFSGFVDDEEYDQLLKEASVVVALTNRKDTMQRAGYEAIMRSVPLVTSDFDVLRDFFEGAAQYVAPGERDLKEKIEQVLMERDSILSESRRLLHARVSEQAVELHKLRKHLSL